MGWSCESKVQDRNPREGRGKDKVGRRRTERDASLGRPALPTDQWPAIAGLSNNSPFYYLIWLFQHPCEYVEKILSL